LLPFDTKIRSAMRTRRGGKDNLELY
jgi:hypothetical protein